jgi:hypothetical protein
MLQSRVPHPRDAAHSISTPPHIIKPWVQLSMRSRPPPVTMFMPRPSAHYFQQRLLFWIRPAESPGMRTGIAIGVALRVAHSGRCADQLVEAKAGLTVDGEDLWLCAVASLEGMWVRVVWRHGAVVGSSTERRVYLRYR